MGEFCQSDDKVGVASISGLGVGTWCWDIRAKVVHWSDEICDLFGVPADGTFQPTFESLCALIHEDDRANAMAVVSTTLSLKRAFHEQGFRLRRADGSIRHILSRAKLELDDKGEPVFMRGVDIDLANRDLANRDLADREYQRDQQPLGDTSAAQDVTEQKRFEQYLNRSEEKYRALFQSIDEGFCIIEILFDDKGEAFDYLFIETNSVFETQTGLSNPVGKTALELVPGLEHWWIKTYGNVALTGESTRFKHGDAAMGRIFDVFASRIGNNDSRQVAILFKDVTVETAVQLSLKQSESRLQFALDAAVAGTWSWDAITNESQWDARYQAQYGFVGDQPPSFDAWISRIHREDRKIVVARLEKMTTSPDDSQWDMEFRALHPVLGERWMLGVGRAERDEHGVLLKVAGLNLDITERKRQEEHRILLLNELNHRVKNTLATVQSMAMQTLRTSPSVDEARQRLDARLMALAKAHDVLTSENWGGALLSDIVEQAITAYRTDMSSRFIVNGPELRVNPKFALALTMALHELCTNAVKYGALSNEDGRVTIIWSATGEFPSIMFSMEWEEAGGPEVTPPTRRGFGSRLIETGLALDLEGEVKINYHPQGVTCSIFAPLAKSRD